MTKEQTVLDKERERENRKVSRSIPFFFFFFFLHTRIILIRSFLRIRESTNFFWHFLSRSNYSIRPIAGINFPKRTKQHDRAMVNEPWKNTQLLLTDPLRILLLLLLLPRSQLHRTRPFRASTNESVQIEKENVVSF